MKAKAARRSPSVGGLARLIKSDCKMYYVYIIRSVKFSHQIYVGCTTNLKKRLSDHNCGTTRHTKRYKPWILVMYLVFADKLKATELEKYLKSGSGRAFRDKRLL